MLAAKIARSMFIIGILLALIIGFFPIIANYTGITGAAPPRTVTPEGNDNDPNEDEIVITTPGVPAPPVEIDRTSTPSTSTPAESDDSNSNGSNGPTGAIVGVVTDLSTGQPGRGVDIQINGSVVRTDSYGNYSLTGLTAGTYVAQLLIPGDMTAAQEPVTLYLNGDSDSLEANLNYYSQAPPVVEAGGEANSPQPGMSDLASEASSSQTTEVQAETAVSVVQPPPLPPAGAVVPGDLPVVWVAPNHINNELDKVGVVNVEIANVANFGAFQAEFSFDPALVRIEAVTVGNFFEQTERDTTPLETRIDNANGVVTLGAFTSGKGMGPDGRGAIVSISFVAKAYGLSGVALDDVRVFNTVGESISVAVVGGRIFVPTCFGDLNGDKQVDVGDVQKAAGRSGTIIGDTHYIPEYDINSDGEINNIDVSIINKRLNQNCL